MVNYDTDDGFSVSSIEAPHQFSSGGGSSYDEGNSSNIVIVPQTTYLKVPSTSVLTISEVHFKHAGNYTCAPSNARQAIITVHVLKGVLNLFAEIKKLINKSFEIIFFFSGKASSYASCWSR